MKNAWMIITAALVASIVLIVGFIGFATLKGRKGVNSDGEPIRYPLKSWVKLLRKIGMTTTALLLVATLATTSVLASGGLSSFMAMFAKAASANPETPDATNGDASQANAETEAENLQEVNDVVHPGLDLSQEELDVLTAGIDFYVGRQSMTSWIPIRSELCGFQNAVSIPLDLMFLDYDYVEELHGRSKTNPDLKALPTADVLKAISEKLEEWQKAYTDLPDDERNQALKDTIKQELASNVIFADMVLQFMCSQKYYTENNTWLLEGKDMLDQAYQEPNGLWSLCEYAEGYDENSECASAHIVYRNDIMERKINSEKEAEEKQKEADGKTNDGDDAVNDSTDDDETEYYSFGYVTLVQRLIALIDETTTVGICKGMKTTENWWLTESANPAFTRTTPSPYQENEDVYLLQVIDKSGRVILSFGFNMKDRRIGLYDRTDKPKVVHDPNLTVRYLEEGTNKQLANPRVEYRVPGTKLDDVKPVSITNYVCTNPDEAKGKIMPDGDLVITFYYRANPPQKTPTYLLTVVCQNEADGKQFASFSLGKHPKGEVVTIPHNSYEGWEFVSGPSTHTMPAKDDTVVLIYRQTPPPGDGNGAKDPAADPENQPANDHGVGDNDDPGVGSDRVNSEDEAKNDVNNSEEQKTFDDQTAKDEQAAADQGKGDSSGTGGEDHTVIDPTAPSENHQNNNPADTTPNTPKDKEIVVDETQVTDGNGNVTTEGQESNAADETNSAVIGVPD